MPPRTVAILPARYASQRFPGKPLALIAGVPMIVRVARRAAAAKRLDGVFVATDDSRIEEVVRAAGFRVIRTSAECASGSDRVAEATRSFDPAPDLVVNVQGDEPLIDPADIDALVHGALAKPEAVSTLARPIDDAVRFVDKNVVKVVCDGLGRALYFSRAPIPARADAGASDPGDRPMQHVGIYAYAPSLLKQMSALPVSRLERLEGLEQLRAMEAGIPIQVIRCVSTRPSIGVDTPADVDAVVAALVREEEGGQGRPK